MPCARFCSIESASGPASSAQLGAAKSLAHAGIETRSPTSKRLLQHEEDIQSSLTAKTTLCN
eukprot:CAMPEP_0178458040 /NCGR_PEP_ID=MMETSP0689_2-20121128/47336_1 /TAXON_ID=160604 /ORGANISM="Amphidinium massartii, Strain CS-259" /LENGTH=61 /DNA_ID=CAMNT_0020084327 /DNA_START=109 /DNA_END=291 /DNA_ORIENTATION=-